MGEAWSTGVILDSIGTEILPSYRPSESVCMGGSVLPNHQEIPWQLEELRARLITTCIPGPHLSCLLGLFGGCGRGKGLLQAPQVLTVRTVKMKGVRQIAALGG